MIIFGSNSGLIKMAESPKAQCSRCNEIGHIKMTRYVKYFHLFWIPTFPYGSKNLSFCSNCHNILYYDQMSKNEKIHFDYFKEFTRLPIWSFSGLILITGIFAWSFISSDIDKENTREYSQTPLKGDLCYWKKSPNTFTALRITKVTKDSIYVLFNDFNTNEISGISQIDLSSNYTTDTISISKTYYLGMVNAHQIVKIKR